MPLPSQIKEEKPTQKPQSSNRSSSGRLQRDARLAGRASAVTSIHCASRRGILVPPLTLPLRKRPLFVPAFPPPTHKRSVRTASTTHTQDPRDRQHIEEKILFSFFLVSVTLPAVRSRKRPSRHIGRRTGRPRPRRRRFGLGPDCVPRCQASVRSGP